MEFDVILVGGGLQSGLLACAIAHREPGCRVLIIERDAALGGNHTWSFHPQDVSDESLPWIAPLISSRWSDYQVRLRGFCRDVNLSYASISSEQFSSHISTLANTTIMLSTNVIKIGSTTDLTSSELSSTEPMALATGLDSATACPIAPEAIDYGSGKKTFPSSQSMGVECLDGRLFRAPIVIDNRGPANEAKSSGFVGGYQKFFGFEIEIDYEWPVGKPIIMDDSVDQTDGFHFVYTLPFTPRRILVEDTYFSNSKLLERDSSLQVVRDYLKKLGVEEYKIVREESGCLPMPISHEGVPRVTTPLSGGYAGGWFHAATGYSFPMAVAFAQAVATNRTNNPADAIAGLAASHAGRARFARFLNRLLFRLVAPKKRYQIFRRFYKVLPDRRIARFYAHQFTPTDAARIVIGLPPGGLRPIQFVKSFFHASPYLGDTNSKASSGVVGVEKLNGYDPTNDNYKSHKSPISPLRCTESSS